MDEKIFNTMIAQDKLNRLCVESFDIAFPIKHISNEINSDKQSRDYMINIIYANYLLRNHMSKNKNKLGVCDFISDYADNSKFLIEVFTNNQGIANEIISDFYNNFFVDNDNNMNQVSSLKIKEKVLAISPIFDTIGFNTIMDFARLVVFKLLNYRYGDKIHDGFDDKYILGLVNNELLKRTIVGDVYTYMCYNNESGVFNNYINMIEENCNDFNAIWNYINQHNNCIRSFIIYFVNFFNDDSDFTEIYKFVNKNHSSFLETLKKLNPCYIMDYISDINNKIYRK